MLLTNGCSFVWGDELKGHDNDPPTHWPYTFTHLLAERLGCEYVNLGTCGASNHKIFRDTMDYLRSDKPKPTHMVILWSAFQREEWAEAMSEKREKSLHIQRWQNFTQISPERLTNVREEVRTNVERYLIEKDVRMGITRTLTYMLNIQYICELLDIKLIQGVFHERMKNNIMRCLLPKHRKDRWGDWMDYTLDQLAELKPHSKIGIDNERTDLYSLSVTKFDIHDYGHPNEDANFEYSRLLHLWFGELYGD